MKSFLCTILLLISFSAISSGNLPIDNTKSVSVVYVGTSGDVSASSFGHIALRLSPKLMPTLKDRVIEFVADIPEGDSGLKKYTKGIGLPGFAYPVKRYIKPFYDFKQNNLIEQNRDVRILEIDMDQAQVDKLVEYIKNYEQYADVDRYTFLKKNCSFFSVLFIEKALGVDIGAKSFPWKVAQKLKDIGLVRKETFYQRSSLAKKALVLEASNKKPSAFPILNSDIDSLSEMMGHENFRLNMGGYMKIHSLLQEFSKQSPEFKTLKRLQLNLKQNELSSLRYVVSDLFKKPHEKILLKAKSIKLPRNANRKSAKFKSRLLAEESKLFVELKVEMKANRNQARKGYKKSTVTKEYMIELPEFEFNTKTKQITYKGIHIGRHIKTKKLDFILSQRVDFGLFYNKDSRLLDTFIYIDPSSEVKIPKLSYEKLLSSGALALNNITDFKGTGGTCKAMVHLQKALTERVIFLESGDIDESINKIELIDSVYKGGYAVISGYTGINDFTKTIDKELFKEYILNLQNQKINQSAPKQLIENLRHQTKLDENTFRNFKAMLDEGVLFSLDIATVQKGTKKLASTVGHSILVYNIEEDGEERFKITAYDPNTGINKLFKINKDFLLESVIYDSKHDYHSALPRLSQGQIEFDNAIRSRPVNYELLKTYQRFGKGTLELPGLSILNILK